MRKNRKSPSPGSREQGYTISKVCCRCGRMQLTTLNDGRVYCKACGTVVQWNPMSEVFRNVDELAQILGFGRPSGDSVELEGRISELEGVIASKEAELSEACSMIEAYRRRISCLESEIHRLDVRHTDIEDLRRENAEIKESMDTSFAALRSELSVYRNENACLQNEIRDLESTNRHISAELDKARTFDLKAILTVMMEYAATVNSTVTDRDDIENVRRMVDARTSQASMKLSGLGVYVTGHKPGDELPEGRVDVTEIHTDDPELDMKVIRSNRYGCTFKDDLYPPIIENLSVNRFTEKKEE